MCNLERKCKMVDMPSHIFYCSDINRLMEIGYLQTVEATPVRKAVELTKHMKGDCGTLPSRTETSAKKIATFSFGEYEGWILILSFPEKGDVYTPLSKRIRAAIVTSCAVTDN